jgi:hypothetical protein
MEGSIIARAAALLVLCALVAGAGMPAEAASANDDIAPQHGPHRVAEAPVADSPERVDVAIGDIESALGWDEHRREYALVATIALLLAGAAIAFSLPPRH